METLGKITDVAIQVATRDRRKRKHGLDGCVIEFLTNYLVKQNDLVQITYKDKAYFFDIKEIEISEKKLLCRAQQTGFWGDAFKRMDNFDLRDLLDVEASIIKDSKTIAHVNTVACYT